MRCLSCNTILTKHEATRKYASSGDFLDLCNCCFHPVADLIPVIEKTTRGGFGADDEDTAAHE